MSRELSPIEIIELGDRLVTPLELGATEVREVRARAVAALAIDEVA